MNSKFTYLICILVLFSCQVEKKESSTSESNANSSIVSNQQSSKVNNLPDISGINHLGDSVYLQRIQAKYILVEFWASWCKPCRQSNPGFVSVYDKYNKEGLEYFSISLDEKESKWKNAIADDQLKWQSHICDFKGWESYWARQYNVQSIPNNVLYDTAGNVVAKELDPDQLNQLLQSLFKK